MRLVDALGGLTSENKFLKILLLGSFALSLFLGGALIKSALRAPLIVERSCVTSVAKMGSVERTADEIEAFVKAAVSQRFDSSMKNENALLGKDELNTKALEIKEFEARKMSQRVLVNSMKVNGGSVEIDADRVISVGPVRSAFSFPIAATIASVERTRENPYGLKLEKVVQTRGVSGG